MTNWNTLARVLLLIVVLLLVLLAYWYWLWGVTGPVKDKSSYEKKEVFLVSDKDWKTALSLVPVGVWTEGAGSASEKILSYPTMVYHLETGGAFDADSIVHFLQQYKPDRVTIVETPPTDLFNLIASYPSTLVGAGLKPSQVRTIPAADLISYWTAYPKVVYVADDYALASLAATYASLRNLPLVVKGGPLDQPAVLSGKQRICVGVTPPPPECAEQLDYPTLQRRYLDETLTPRLVVINPNDLGSGVSAPYQPEKSGTSITTTFSNESLAAPVLASAKHELLVPIDLSGVTCGPHEGTSNSDFLQADSEIETLINTVMKPDIEPTYLTLVATPKAIQYWSNCSSAHTGAADWQYGSLDNEEPLLHVGRIYGITVSDASAYVARALFYDDLMDDTYGEGVYNGLAIAAPNFGQDQINAEAIKQKTDAAGYSTECFTWHGATAQPSCDVYTAILSADYQRRQFVSFADHGGPSSWGGTLASANIPWLDLPYTVSLACLTNDFWGGQNITFGPTWIRKGGISYHASIPSTDGYNWELWSMQELTGAARKSLGEIATTLIQRTDYSSEVKRQYILLGDPTLIPEGKEVVW